jgi:endo-1,4-beta-mannosidase
MAEQQIDQNFSLGISYWPLRSSYRAWSGFDRGAVREELAHIASMGCDTVRLCLRWEDFQPGPERLGREAIRGLEPMLDAVQEAGLGAVLALFVGGLGGARLLPQWTTGHSLVENDPTLVQRYGAVLRAPGPQATVVYADGHRKVQLRDIYENRAQIQAQQYLIRELVGNFSAHSAVKAWQLGYDLERVLLPSSNQVARDWYRRICEYARQQGAKQIIGVASPRSLTSSAALRPEQIAAESDQVGIHTFPHEPLRLSDPRSPVGVGFLYHLTASLVGKPVLVTNLGLASAPDNQSRWIADRAFGRVARSYLATEDEQAAFLESSLQTLWQAGASGIWLAAYGDVPRDLWGVAPFDRFQRERTIGLIRADGREKAAAEVVRRFAHEHRDKQRHAPASPMEFDPERYWHKPAEQIQHLLRESSFNA